MSSSRRTFHHFVVAGLLCVPPLVNLLQYWLHNPIYGYGLWVPFLTAYLLWQRHGMLQQPREAPLPNRSALSIVIIGAYLLALLPIRVVQIANPDWRLLDWLLSVGAICSVLALFYRVGGSVLLKELWFPACLLITAVPWSTAAEQAFITHAIRLTGRISSELLWLIGVPAVDSGKSIYTSAGPILISEDCSGIRSFHLATMATFFWIGYFRLKLGRAIWMWTGAAALTLILNTLRVVTLVAIVAKTNQLSRMHYWHDQMGSLAQILLVVALPALAWMLRSRPASERLPGVTPGFWRVPGWAGVALFIWLVGVGGLSEAWFRIHESPSRSVSDYWGINLKPEGVALEEKPVAQTVRENYFYTEGHSLTWDDPNHAPWSFIYMDFDKGALSACTHNVHRPEVCLSFADCSLLSEAPPLKVVVSGREATLAHKVFQRENRPFHLFHGYLQNVPDRDSQVDWTYEGRLRAARMGLRSHRAELVFLTVLAGYPLEQARQAASEYLSQLLVRKSE